MRNKFDLATINNTITNPHASRLQALVQEKLTDDRLGTVVDKLLDKADKGDTKALDYLLTVGGFRQPAPTTVVVQQFYQEVQQEPPRQVTNIAAERKPLQMIVGLLGASDQLTPASIASQTGLPEADVIHELDAHPEVFAVHGNLYSLVSTRKKAKR